MIVMDIFPVDIRKLAYKYPGSNLYAIKGVNLSISEGEIMRVKGPSGSGKTTLLKLLVRLLNPPQGTIMLGSKDILRISVRIIRGKICLMLSPPVFLDSIIHENFHIPGIRYEYSFIKKYFDALCLPLCYLDKHPSSLSYGEKQRISLIRVLCQRPRILLLDEPVNGLDADNAENVLALLKMFRQNERMSIVIASHQEINVTGLKNFQF